MNLMENDSKTFQKEITILLKVNKLKKKKKNSRKTKINYTMNRSFGTDVDKVAMHL